MVTSAWPISEITSHNIRRWSRLWVLLHLFSPSRYRCTLVVVGHRQVSVFLRYEHLLNTESLCINHLDIRHCLSYEWVTKLLWDALFSDIVHVSSIIDPTAVIEKFEYFSFSIV